jgi:hypothetical protein
VRRKRRDQKATGEEAMTFNRFKKKKAKDGEEAPTKYRAQKVVIDGRAFHSKAEADRSVVLRHLEMQGVISELEFQPHYVLFEKFHDNCGRLNRACIYIADFAYIEDGKSVVEDVKGMITPDYKIKAKLFRKQYPELVHREVKNKKDMLTAPKKPKKPRRKSLS